MHNKFSHTHIHLKFVCWPRSCELAVAFSKKGFVVANLLRSSYLTVKYELATIYELQRSFQLEKKNNNLVAEHLNDGIIEAYKIALKVTNVMDALFRRFRKYICN